MVHYDNKSNLKLAIQCHILLIKNKNQFCSTHTFHYIYYYNFFAFVEINLLYLSLKYFINASDKTKSFIVLFLKSLRVKVVDHFYLYYP